MQNDKQLAYYEEFNDTLKESYIFRTSRINLDFNV